MDKVPKPADQFSVREDNNKRTLWSRVTSCGVMYRLWFLHTEERTPEAGSIAGAGAGTLANVTGSRRVRVLTIATTSASIPESVLVFRGMPQFSFALTDELFIPEKRTSDLIKNTMKGRGRLWFPIWLFGKKKQIVRLSPHTRKRRWILTSSHSIESQLSFLF